jgi:hypothetical protein
MWSFVLWLIVGGQQIPEEILLQFSHQISLHLSSGSKYREDGSFIFLQNGGTHLPYYAMY